MNAINWREFDGIAKKVITETGALAGVQCNWANQGLDRTIHDWKVVGDKELFQDALEAQEEGEIQVPQEGFAILLKRDPETGAITGTMVQSRADEYHNSFVDTGDREYDENYPVTDTPLKTKLMNRIWPEHWATEDAEGEEDLEAPAAAPKWGTSARSQRRERARKAEAEARRSTRRGIERWNHIA